jgi:hypothetical protein
MIMKRIVLFAIVLLAVEVRLPSMADTNALTLIKTIPLPDVRGRIDHFALDVQGQRLFMAALGNDTVEVIDLAAGKRLRTIAECSTPQGLAFVPEKNLLVIANGGSGTVKILDASSFKTVHSIENLPDADNVRYDAKSGLIYVGYGDGALAVIRPATGELLADIKLGGHPESFQLEQNGSRIFVNVPGTRQVAVVDREKREVVAKWHWEKVAGNFPMALDESNHRLFIGCRGPVWLLIADADTGNFVKVQDLSGDVDDLFYDAGRRLIYASCGSGFLDVIEQRDADAYQLCQRIKTVSGARTCYFSPERGELYLAVRAGLISGSAEVRIFKCAH